MKMAVEASVDSPKDAAVVQAATERLDAMAASVCRRVASTVPGQAVWRLVLAPALLVGALALACGSAEGGAEAAGLCGGAAPDLWTRRLIGDSERVAGGVVAAALKGDAVRAYAVVREGSPADARVRLLGVDAAGAVVRQRDLGPTDGVPALIAVADGLRVGHGAFELVAVDAAGELKWQRALAGGLGQGASQLSALAAADASDSGAGLALVGGVELSGPGQKGRAAAWVLTDAQGLATASVRQSLDARASLSAVVADAAASSGPGWLAVGWAEASVSASGRQGVVLGLDAKGVVRLLERHGGVLDDELRAIVRTPEGWVAAGSTRSSGAGGADGWLLGLDPAGKQRFVATFGGAGEDEFHAIAALSGDLALAGRSLSDEVAPGGGWLLGVRQVGAQATLSWQTSFDGAGIADLRGLAVDGQALLGVGSTALGSAAGATAALWVRVGADGRSRCGGEPCADADSLECGNGFMCVAAPTGARCVAAP